MPYFKVPYTVEVEGERIIQASSLEQAVLSVKSAGSEALVRSSDDIIGTVIVDSSEIEIISDAFVEYDAWNDRLVERKGDADNGGS